MLRVTSFSPSATVRRLSPNVWNVGDIVRVGAITFRAAVVYPSVLFEVVDDADLQGSEDRKGVPAVDGEGAV